MSTVSVGIDVCTEFLDIHLRPANRSFRLKNDPDGHAEFIRQLRSLGTPSPDLRLCMEATGGLETPLAVALAEAGFPVAVINPRQIRDFAKASGRRAKTDKLDAAVLAHFAEAMQPRAHAPLPENLRQFRDILDRRAQLLQMRTMENNRLASTTHKPVKRDLQLHLAWLDKRIKAAEKELDELVAANFEWKLTDELLQSIPGFGVQTARVLIGQLPELGKFDRRSLANLVGLAPMNDDSGDRVGGRRIVGGRSHVRRALYMAALSAIRYYDNFKTVYASLVARGKAKKVAIIAVARKLLCIANAILRDQKPWRDSDSPKPETA
jgi:transposase